MITIFTTPKSFKGKFKLIQENAIRSWIALGPEVEVFLMGNEPGISDAAKRLKVAHIEKIKSNPSGLPYLNSLFELARQKAKNNILAYINSDIVLFPDLISSLKVVEKQKKKYLIIGRRIDIDQNKKINFNNRQELAFIKRKLKSRGRLHDYHGIDYFVFPKDFWKKIPPFAVARTEFDRWLVGEGKRISKNVIDATSAITAMHQNHDYSAIPGGREGELFIKEAALNEKLARGVKGDVKSADYILSSDLKLNRRNNVFDFEIFVLKIKNHVRHFLKERIFRQLQHLFS